MSDISIILKGKVIDQRRALNYLSRNPAFLNVSYSWNGMGKYKDTLFCGINKLDRTNHRLFELQHEIVLTQPLSFTALDSAVRDHAKARNIDLGSDKFKPYIVTSVEVDIGKAGATTAKRRAVVVEPTPTLSFARGCDENPDEKSRLIHLFYGEIGHTVADLSNAEGGSAAVNVSKFLKMCDNVGSVLQLKFNDSKGTLPSFAQNFFFPSALHLKQLLKEAADRVVRSDVLNCMSTGNYKVEFDISVKITSKTLSPSLYASFSHRHPHKWNASRANGVDSFATRLPASSWSDSAGHSMRH